MEWVLVALRMIAHRASMNGRKEIRVEDVEFAIQQVELEMAVKAYDRRSADED